MRLKGIELRKFNIYRLGDLSEGREFLKFPLNKKDLIYKIVDRNNLGDIISTREKSICFVFKRYLDEGEQGYYVYFEDRVIACGWVFFNFGSYSVKKEYIVIPKNFAWLHNFWTHPDFRGYGIYPTLLRYICKDIFLQGKVPHPHNILIDTDCGNIASNSGIIKANFEFIGNITALRVYKIWLVLRETYGRKI